VTEEEGRRLPPIAVALAIQLVAGMICFGIALVINRNADFNLDLPLVVVAQGFVAALITYHRGLPRWWLIIQLVLPAGVAAAMLFNLPSWIYLAAFFVIWLFYSNASGEGVPLYLSNQKTWTALAELLPEASGSRCIDLGSGLGGTTLFLANHRPDVTFEAVETAPVPFVSSWLRYKLFAPANCTVRYANIWQMDLSGYDWVYCFLSPQPMPRLYAKAVDEMKSGSRLVSNSFDVPGHEAEEVVEVGDSRKTRLLIWQMD
jgi:hypothetical protein